MCPVVMAYPSTSFIISGSLLYLFDTDLTLEQSFLLYHFLSKMHYEFQTLQPRCDLETQGDIDELISLKQMVRITLKSKIKGLLKYTLQHLYLNTNLTPLIESISRSLSLLNLVDRQLGYSMWYEAFDTAISTYFFYFVFVGRETFDQWDKSTLVEHPSLLEFSQEIERLSAFFGTFVKGKNFEKTELKTKIMIEYLKAADTQAAMGFLKSLITTGTLKSYQFLVDYHNLRKM